jgi:hypothetical protein
VSESVSQRLSTLASFKSRVYEAVQESLKNGHLKTIVELPTLAKTSINTRIENTKSSILETKDKLQETAMNKVSEYSTVLNSKVEQTKEQILANEYVKTSIEKAVQYRDSS